MAVTEGTRRIVGGVDTHKDLHVAAVVDEQDRVMETRSFATTRQGYRQMLGRRFDDGVDLSGGEWQKIALARAFWRHARILVVDEPTSALDPLAEAELRKKGGKIVDLSHERIVELGDATVVGLPGAFERRQLHADGACVYGQKDLDALAEALNHVAQPAILVAALPPRGQDAKGLDVSEGQNVGDPRLVAPDSSADHSAKLEALRELLAEALDGREFLVGDRFTVADIVASEVVAAAGRMGAYEPSGRLAEYLAAMQRRPARERAGARFA